MTVPEGGPEGLDPGIAYCRVARIWVSWVLNAELGSKEAGTGVG